MKEYSEHFYTKDSENRVSVRTQNGKIILSLDYGLDGMYEVLNKKEIEQLISMLKKATKKINQ